MTLYQCRIQANAGYKANITSSTNDLCSIIIRVARAVGKQEFGYEFFFRQGKHSMLFCGHKNICLSLVCLTLVYLSIFFQEHW